MADLQPSLVCDAGKELKRFWKMPGSEGQGLCTCLRLVHSRKPSCKPQA